MAVVPCVIRCFGSAIRRHALGGYEDDDELPPYRKVVAPIRLDGFAGMNRIQGQHVPVTALPDFVRESGFSNEVPIRQSISEIASIAEGARKETGSIRVVLPGDHLIGKYFDQGSGSPYQKTEQIYWDLSPAALDGLLDNVRTSLTELITELVTTVPRGQDLPTVDQAQQAVQVAINGSRRAHVTVNTAQATEGASSTVALPPAPKKSTWWTRAHMVGAFVVGCCVVAGTIIAWLAYIR